MQEIAGQRNARNRENALENGVSRAASREPVGLRGPDLQVPEKQAFTARQIAARRKKSQKTATVSPAHPGRECSLHTNSSGNGGDALLSRYLKERGTRGHQVDVATFDLRKTQSGNDLRLG